MKDSSGHTTSLEVQGVVQMDDKQDKDRLQNFGRLLIKYMLGQDRRCENFRAFGPLGAKAVIMLKPLRSSLKNNAAATLSLLSKQHAGGLSKQNNSWLWLSSMSLHQASNKPQAFKPWRECELEVNRGQSKVIV